MTKFLLIRHGESEANKNKIFAGHYNAPLSEKGLEQARKTALFVKEKYKVDKAYASDLQRAFVTGKTATDLIGIDIEPMQELREIYAGKWDGMVFDEIKNVYPEDFELWMTDIGNACCTGGEKVSELYDRISTILNKLAEENEGKTVLIATHATSIRVAVAHALYNDVSKTNMIKWAPNASVTELNIDNGNWTVGKVSQDEHLSKLKTVLPPNV